LIAIAKLVESGELTKQEIYQSLSVVHPSSTPLSQDPLVLTFGINVSELIQSNGLPKNAGDTFPVICDWLEKDLIFRLSGLLPTLSQMTEASERNGETLSVRVAFWNLDFDLLDQFDISNWKVLEIADFSEIYDCSPDELLSRAVVKAGGSIVSDPWDTAFGVGRCPRCGSSQLNRYSSTDRKYDETYHTIECKECGWSEWTQ